MSSKKPLIVAHRGAHTLAPENTITAGKLALQNGATALEVDVRLCATGEIVLFHDNFLWHHLRQLKPVIFTGLPELKELQFSLTAEQHSDSICTLDEFLEEFKNTAPLNLDVKTFMTDYFTLADTLVKTVRRHNVTDQVWFSAFNPLFLLILKRKYPDIRVGYLFRNMPYLHVQLDLMIRAEAWHAHYHLINPAFLQKAKERGKEVYVWTINDAQTFRNMLSYSFDGIITDILIDPDVKKTVGSSR